MSRILVNTNLRGSTVGKNSVRIIGLRRIERKLNTVANQTSLEAANVAKKMIQDNIKPFSKSGKLLHSFKVKVNSKRKATVYSNSPYSRIQNLGGRIKITQRMRKKMWALYKKTGKKVYKAIAITKKSYVTIPAKEYTTINKRIFNKRVKQSFHKLINKKKYFG